MAFLWREFIFIFTFSFNVNNIIGKYNYNHYPKLTDRQAYADAVNDGTWKSGTPADLNTGLVGDTSGTYKKK